MLWKILVPLDGSPLAEITLPYAEEMVIGVPYQRLLRIVDNIDLSIAGTARPDLLLRLVGTLLRRHVPSNSR